MKNMRRLFAMVLAVMMVLSLETTAFAATTGTVKNDTDRAYKAYQIFSGTQAADSTALGDIAWGTGIDVETFLPALKALKINESAHFASCETPADVAAALKGVADKSEIAQAFANLAAKHLTTTATDVAANATATLPSGYYLLVDQTPVADQDKAKNPALLQVTNDSNLNITDKSGKPTVEKQVDDTDLNIGDKVTFTLTATMPATFEGYDTYKVVFHDTLYKGLTYNGDAKADVEGFTVTSGKDSDDNTTITITCTDVLAKGVKAGDTITVTYTATLNADAISGINGNFNKVYLEYSNDPETEGTGKTPEKEVKVYTWDMGVLKYADGDKSKVLEGVKFILLNEANSKIAKVANGKIVSWDDFNDETVIANYELTTDKDGKIAIAGLESGKYWLRETQALPGYNKLVGDTEVNVDNNDDGTYKTFIAEVENNAGSTLPETGGMGTTLFYILGSIMVLAAVVLLVTKKRMAAAE